MASTNISSALRMSLGFKKSLRCEPASGRSAASIASGTCEPAVTMGTPPRRDRGPCQGYVSGGAGGSGRRFDPGEEIATNRDVPADGAVVRGQVVAETGFEPVTKG